MFFQAKKHFYVLHKTQTFKLVKSARKNLKRDVFIFTKPTFSKVKFPSVDAIVNLTEDQQKTINARLKLIGADRMKYAFSGDTLTLTLFTTKTGDTYVEEFTLDEPVSTDFELITPATGFSLLPVGNFKVNVSKAGIMEFKQLRNDAVDLSLYIAKAKND